MKTAQDFVAEARQHIQEISLQEADSAIQAADLLLDVREGDLVSAKPYSPCHKHFPGPAGVQIQQRPSAGKPGHENRGLTPKRQAAQH